MKSIKSFLFVCVTAFLFSSCSHCIYPLQTLNNNYHSRMKTEEELAVKSKVNIYFNENDIKGEFEVVSLNTYNPPFTFGIKPLFTKKMNQKFLKEAVLKAYEEGGNAILVKGAGSFYVLNLKNWVADDMAAATFVNPIFDMTLSEEIKGGSVASMKYGERTRKEKAFIDEIDSNIGNMSTLEEIGAIREKITVLSNYNLTLKHQKSSIEKKVKKFTKKCNRMEKRLNRAAAKKTKEAVQKADAKADKIIRSVE